MKINEIIREKRKELGMTQEQIAEFLGVSTPSVNKWERGNTYPDITLLPPLARLLRTDLNTLLSFKDDLSEIEIGHIINEVCELIRIDGFDAGYQAAVAKIREYPSCDMLTYSLAVCLNGSLTMFAVEDKEQYVEFIDTLIERSTKSDDPLVKTGAISVQLARLFDNSEFDKAEEMIGTLPTTSLDQKTMLANLYLKTKRYDEAAKTYESKILELSVNIEAALLGLTLCALNEDRIDDAQYCADVYERMVKEFGIADYNAPSVQLEVAAKKQDTKRCLALINEMLASMSDNWVVKHPKLYRKLELTNKHPENMNSKMLIPAIIKSLEDDEKLRFMREEPEFKAILAEYRQV